MVAPRGPIFGYQRAGDEAPAPELLAVRPSADELERNMKRQSMKRRLKIIAEDAGRPVKHFGPWILDFGLQNCTISAPFLHHFSRFSKSHPLIINHLQKKLHHAKRG